MNIYVGNLGYDVTEANLEQLFSAHGKVVSAKVISDMYSGKSRGFGFVEMESKNDGANAIAALNGTDFGGRQLVVNEARPKREGGGGGGGDRGDRGGRGGGDRGGRGGGGGGGYRR